MNATLEAPAATTAVDSVVDIDRLEARLAIECPGAQILLGHCGPAVVLELMYLPSTLRGSGLGRRALERLCAWADETGTELRLQLSDGWGSDVRRLSAWYSSVGFVFLPQHAGEFRAPWMRRLPTAAAAVV